MSITKELKYLAMAAHFGRAFSKDRSTQVGAFFMHPTEYTLLATGYNGLPRGCDDEKAERHERPLKYEFFEHAECNAIYNCVREIFRGCTLRVSEQMQANDIRALISVGTSKVYTTVPIASATGMALLAEAGVEVVEIYPSELPGRQASFVHIGADEPLSRVAISPTEMPTSDISAVRQAIFNVARKILKGSIAAVAPLPPCQDCAQAIHAVGAGRVVTYEPTADQNERWGSSFGATRALFAAHGIHMHEAPQD
jgi:deoxycytidylate deaminase